MSNVLQAHLRLTCLRALSGAPGYRANSSIIHTVTGEFGIMATRDQIKSELAWLAEQGLVETSEVGAMTIATLTERGLDVADGRATVPGVQRPAPGA
jgi:hypothetical protein